MAETKVVEEEVSHNSTEAGEEDELWRKLTLLWRMRFVLVV